MANNPTEPTREELLQGVSFTKEQAGAVAKLLNELEIRSDG